MPRVSVISTVYNGEPYFERSVPGILHQSLKDFEWIIVDDGSNDRTPGLLSELQSRDPRVRVVSAGRVGRAKALNLAVENARTEYIANQDFDDSSNPDRLKLQADFMDTHPEVGVLGGHYLVIDKKRGERYVRMPPIEHRQITMAMASRIPFAHTVVMFRKSAWQDANGYPQVDKLIDFRLWIAMGALGWKFACLPQVLGEHFVYPESYWHRNFAYQTSQREIANSQLVAINALGLPFWTRIYPLGRYIYWLLPNRIKRFARRFLGGSNEQDVAGS
ncbi:MAG: glycosyltransferase family 2 protein [Gammaproteobacteria bacterium]